MGRAKRRESAVQGLRPGEPIFDEEPMAVIQLASAGGEEPMLACAGCHAPLLSAEEHLRQLCANSTVQCELPHLVGLSSTVAGGSCSCGGGPPGTVMTLEQLAHTDAAQPWHVLAAAAVKAGPPHCETLLLAARLCAESELVGLQDLVGGEKEGEDAKWWVQVGAQSGGGAGGGGGGGGSSAVLEGGGARAAQLVVQMDVGGELEALGAAIAIADAVIYITR